MNPMIWKIWSRSSHVAPCLDVFCVAIQMLDTFHDHLNSQEAGGGSRKNKKLGLTVSVNSVHSHSQGKKYKKCGIDFVPDKAYYVICDNCHQSKIQGKLELTDNVKKKIREKKRLKQKKNFTKQNAGKLNNAGKLTRKKK